jgi:hypothetical protein
MKTRKKKEDPEGVAGAHKPHGYTEAAAVSLALLLLMIVAIVVAVMWVPRRYQSPPAVRASRRPIDPAVLQVGYAPYADPTAINRDAGLARDLSGTIADWAAVRFATNPIMQRKFTPVRWDAADVSVKINNIKGLKESFRIAHVFQMQEDFVDGAATIRPLMGTAVLQVDLVADVTLIIHGTEKGPTPRPFDITLPEDIPYVVLYDSYGRFWTRCAHAGTLQTPSGPSTLFRAELTRLRPLQTRLLLSSKDIDAIDSIIKKQHLGFGGISHTLEERVEPAVSDWVASAIGPLLADLNRNASQLYEQQWSNLCLQALPSGLVGAAAA